MTHILIDRVGNKEPVKDLKNNYPKMQGKQNKRKVGKYCEINTRRTVLEGSQALKGQVKYELRKSDIFINMDDIYDFCKVVAKMRQSNERVTSLIGVG